MAVSTFNTLLALFLNIIQGFRQCYQITRFLYQQQLISLALQLEVEPKDWGDRAEAGAWVS